MVRDRKPASGNVRAMPQPEATFKRRLRDSFVELFGRDRALCWAFVPTIGQPSGIPDQAFGANGRLAWVESKVGAFKMSAIQKVQAGRLAFAGQRVLRMTLRGDVVTVATLGGDGEPVASSSHPLSQIKTQGFWAEVLDAH